MLPRINRLRTPQFARRKRRQFLLKAGALCAGVVLLLAGAVFLLRHEKLQIESVVVEGGEVVDVRALTNFISGTLAEKYLWLVPKSNVLLIPEDSLEASVLKSFPRLNTIELSRTDFRTLSVVVKEREPRALWCGENRLGEGSTPSCYFLDEHGFVYAPAPSFSGEVYIRLYGPLGGGEPIGQFFLTAEYFTKLRAFAEALQSRDVKALELALIDERDAELYLEDGTKILLDPSEDLDYVLDNLLSVLTSATFKERDKINLEYLDLRFGNKVYYKERDQQ